MMEAATPLLEGRNLRKTYRLSRRNQVKALRGVEIRIEPGEMVALMGPSGSGKSTLMHILGLLHSPDEEDGPPAELSIAGVDVTSMSERTRTRMRADTMGFVFQSYNLVPTLTAAENVALAGEYAGTGRREAMSAASEALGWVGLAERAGHRPMELSGGEQQRVAIAAAAARRAPLVLADEPTAELDERNEAIVLDEFRRLRADFGATVVVVTHSPAVAASADRVVEIRDGRVVV